jgi:DNA-binding NarL/FixJ family response regulator
MPSQPLSRREGHVLRLLGRGLSNKEIAGELFLGVSTIKHHVHNILKKLELSQRGQAMQRVRDAPWIVAPTDEGDVRRAIHT